MTQWKQDFITYYRKREQWHGLAPTPQPVLDHIAGLGEDVVNGKTPQDSVFMLVGMLTSARDPERILEAWNGSERDAASGVEVGQTKQGDLSI